MLWYTYVHQCIVRKLCNIFSIGCVRQASHLLHLLGPAILRQQKVAIHSRPIGLKVSVSVRHTNTSPCMQ